MPTMVSPGPRRLLRSIHWRQLNWAVVLGIAAMHLACVLAPFYFSWTAVGLMVFLAWVTGGLGVTLGYHRLLTHRSFQTPKWLEHALAGLGCLAWQGGPVQWVGTHRLHHAHSDGPADPHSPNDGFTWAHVFWCMQRNAEGRPAEAAAQDLQRDPVLRLLNRYFWLGQVGLAGLLWGAGTLAHHWGWPASGWSWVVWGVAVRTVAVYHLTWFVNSAAHTWGYRNFATADRSTNLWWVALLGFGEGWHNNHHAHQRSAAHGLRWFEFDLTYWTIRVLGWVGLARRIVRPDPKWLQRRPKAADGAEGKVEDAAAPDGAGILARGQTVQGVR